MTILIKNVNTKYKLSDLIIMITCQTVFCRNCNINKDKMSKINFNKEEFSFNVKKIQTLINENDNFFFYFSPDFDSVCCSLSLVLYLKRIKKNALIYFPLKKDKSYDFLLKIADYNRISIISDLDELKTELSSKEYVFVILDTPNKNLLPNFEVVNTVFNSYKQKKSIEVDHHFGNDSEMIYPGSIPLFKYANSCCDIIADFFWECGTKLPSNVVDMNEYFPRNIVLTLLTGICSDTQLGKFCPIVDERNWLEILTDRLNQLTWKESDNFKTPSEIFDVITKKNKSKSIVIEKIMESGKIQNGLGLLIFPNVGKTDNLLPKEKLFCSYSLEDISDDLANLLPEKAGKVGIFAYFDGKKEKYMIKIRRSVAFHELDLRQLDALLIDLFGKDFCGGGGHSGAVSFRISHEIEAENFIDKINTLFFSVLEKYFSD